MAEVQVPAQILSLPILNRVLVELALECSIFHQSEVLHLPVPGVVSYHVPLDIELSSGPVVAEDAPLSGAIELRHVVSKFIK